MPIVYLYLICVYGLIPSHCISSLLTCHGKATQCTGFSLGLTHPLLTALSWYLDPPWHGAVRPRQHHVHVAARHAGDLPITAHTLILAGGEERLAVLVDRTIQNTDISFMSWWTEVWKGVRIFIFISLRKLTEKCKFLGSMNGQ